MSTEDFQKLVIARLDRIDTRQEQILTALNAKPKKSKEDRLIAAVNAVKIEGCRTFKAVAKSLGICERTAYRCPTIRHVLKAAAREAASEIRTGLRTDDGVEAYE